MQKETLKFVYFLHKHTSKCVQDSSIVLVIITYTVLDFNIIKNSLFFIISDLFYRRFIEKLKSSILFAVKGSYCTVGPQLCNFLGP